MSHKLKKRKQFHCGRLGNFFLGCLAVFGAVLPFSANAEVTLNYAKAAIKHQPYTLKTKVPNGQNTVLASTSSLGFTAAIGLKTEILNPFIHYEFNTSRFQGVKNATILCNETTRHRLSSGLDFQILTLSIQLGLALGQEYFLRTPNSPNLIIDRIWMPQGFINLELPFAINDDPMSDFMLFAGVKAKAAALPPVKSGNIKTKSGEIWGGGGFLRLNWFDFSINYSRQRQDTSDSSQSQFMLDMELAFKYNF